MVLRGARFQLALHLIRMVYAAAVDHDGGCVVQARELVDSGEFVVLLPVHHDGGLVRVLAFLRCIFSGTHPPVLPHDLLLHFSGFLMRRNILAHAGIVRLLNPCLLISFVLRG